MMPVTIAIDLVRVMDQEMNERHREAARRREIGERRQNRRGGWRSPASALISAIRLNGA